jgi:hypothetical protein
MVGNRTRYRSFDRSLFSDVETNPDMQHYVSAITEIVAIDFVVDCEFIAKYFQSIEKLDIQSGYSCGQLKNTKLKHVGVNVSLKPDLLIKYLPPTIESLIIYQFVLAMSILICQM